MNDALVPLVDIAIQYRDAGLSMIGTHNKRFVGETWTPFQSSAPTDEQIGEMLIQDAVDQIAIVCGAVSGNLECLDFDDAGSQYQAWAAMVEEEEPGLLSRLPMEKTPSMVAMRCPQCGGAHTCIKENGKLWNNGVCGECWTASMLTV